MDEIHYLDNGQWTLEKSNYGPKGAKLYNIADNAKRKMSNTGEATGLGPNSNAKHYGGFGGAKVAHIEDARIKRMNAKQPVKTYSPEEIAEYKKKVAKAEHLDVHANGQWTLKDE